MQLHPHSPSGRSRLRGGFRSWRAYRLVCIRILKALAILIAISLFLPDHVNAESGAVTLYIPLVQATQDEAACVLSAQEQDLASLMLSDPRQQRAELSCNPILSQIAHAMAEDMATRNYFDTVTPEGFGPNYLARKAGYVLPAYYNQGQNANNIASIAAGLDSADQVWVSQSGSQHLHGLSVFFEEQTEFGVGFAHNPNSTYRYYWVIITAQAGD